MKTHKLISLMLAAALGALTVPACDLDVPDLNNPPLSDLADNPTPVTVNAACTGLLLGSRRNISAANGYVSQLGILGRESYNFDTGSDPRYVSETIAGPLSAGSPFGGNFWANPYANIRLGNTILSALGKIPAEALSEAARAGIRGFVNTINAHDLLEVIVTHDTNGAVIDVDRPLGAALGPIVDKDTVYADIVRRLEAAATDLAGAGNSFTFQFSPGYAGFTTPATFLTFNRALRARVAVYMKDYPTALTALAASFLDESATADFDEGVYHVFSTKTGDAVNGLINPNIFGHPLIRMEAQTNGTVLDARFTAKVDVVPDADAGGNNDPELGSNLRFDPLYPGPDARVAVIRNEELLLLKAEAQFFTMMTTEATATLNIVRTRSGGLAPLDTTTSEPAFLNQLLYERQYSLLFEGGHRWIDARRFNRLERLVLDYDDFVRNVRYPIPLAECNARPGEAACMGGSL